VGHTEDALSVPELAGSLWTPSPFLLCPCVVPVVVLIHVSHCDQNPELAGSLWTTGADYNRFLDWVIHHQGLPVQVVKDMETDHTPNGVVKVTR
jgi:hypothetical protein